MKQDINYRKIGGAQPTTGWQKGCKKAICCITYKVSEALISACKGKQLRHLAGAFFI